MVNKHITETWCALKSSEDQGINAVVAKFLEGCLTKIKITKTCENFDVGISPQKQKTDQKRKPVFVLTSFASSLFETVTIHVSE